MEQRTKNEFEQYPGYSEHSMNESCWGCCGEGGGSGGHVGEGRGGGGGDELEMVVKLVK